MTALTVSNGFAALQANQHLSSAESKLVSMVNASNIYTYDTELEQIALNHTLSLYSYRSSGSIGANATAEWIEKQFESFGLDTHNETFQFTTWNLLAQPNLTIDNDGNLSTTNDQERINSFQCEQYSWPTPEAGVLNAMVTLPLPYQGGEWNAVNTTGKVLLMGAEVEYDQDSFLPFSVKLQTQTPSAVLFSWSSSSMAFSPAVFDSCGGRPNLGTGSFFWNYHIPVGWVSYSDGLMIRDKINSPQGVYAYVSVQSVIGQGPHYNVVAKLSGSEDPQKMILISAHYDSTMEGAFCDNGAGTAAVLELAGVFSEAAQQGFYKPQYTIVFAAFAGEELGLEGSANYAKQHASELGNIVAMIDLDSIGSANMEITRTFPDDKGLNLQDIFTNAASNLNTKIELTDPGNRRSDFQVFLDPADTSITQLQLQWGSNVATISSTTRVKSSILIDSTPQLWIHTENDSSSTANWVTADNLGNQTSVIALSMIRVISSLTNPFLLELYGSITIAIVFAAAIAFFERKRLRPMYRRLAHEVRNTIGMREVLYVVILTVLLLFISFAFFTSVGEIEVMSQGYPRVVSVQYYGAPFKMFGTINTDFASSEVTRQTSTAQVGTFSVLWAGLLANIILCAFSAFVVTYALSKIEYGIEFNRQARVRT